MLVIPILAIVLTFGLAFAPAAKAQMTLNWESIPDFLTMLLSLPMDMKIVLMRNQILGAVKLMGEVAGDIMGVRSLGACEGRPLILK